MIIFLLGNFIRCWWSISILCVVVCLITISKPVRLRVNTTANVCRTNCLPIWLGSFQLQRFHFRLCSNFYLMCLFVRNEGMCCQAEAAALCCRHSANKPALRLDLVTIDWWMILTFRSLIDLMMDSYVNEAIDCDNWCCCSSCRFMPRFVQSRFFIFVYKYLKKRNHSSCLLLDGCNDWAGAVGKFTYIFEFLIFLWMIDFWIIFRRYCWVCCSISNCLFLLLLIYFIQIL